MHILNQWTNYYTSAWIIVILAIIAICFLLFAYINVMVFDYKGALFVSIISLLLCFTSIILACVSSEPKNDVFTTHTTTSYQVIFDDNYSINDLINKYEIKQVTGKIIEIEEKR